MIVVDTNIIVGFWIPSEMSDMIEKLFSKDSEWIAPMLWKSEFRNVMAGLIRKKIITFDQSLEIITNAEEQFKEKEFIVDSTQIMNLVNSSTCSAYDCEFVALAMDLGIPLYTNDKLILKSFPRIAKTIPGL